MVNSRGQTINCGHVGGGYVGAPLALLATEECKSKAEKSGYFDLADASKPIVLKGSNVTSIQAQNGFVRIDLPKKWRAANNDSSVFKGSTYDLLASTSSGDAYYSVQSVGFDIATNPDAYFSSYRSAVAKRYPEVGTAPLESVKIFGFEAKRYEASFWAGKILVKRVAYLVKAEKRLFMIQFWAEDKKFVRLKADFDSILNATHLM